MVPLREVIVPCKMLCGEPRNPECQMFVHSWVNVVSFGWTGTVCAPLLLKMGKDPDKHKSGKVGTVWKLCLQMTSARDIYLFILCLSASFHFSARLNFCISDLQSIKNRSVWWSLVLVKQSKKANDNVTKVTGHENSICKRRGLWEAEMDGGSALHQLMSRSTSTSTRSVNHQQLI